MPLVIRRRPAQRQYHLDYLIYFNTGIWPQRAWEGKLRWVASPGQKQPSVNPHKEK